MKITFILLVFFGLISCQQSKTEKEPPTIVGKWKLYETSGSNGGAKMYTSNVDFDYFLELDKHGNFIISESDKTENGSFIIKGNKILQLNSSKKDTLYFDFFLKGETLLLNPVNEIGQFVCDEGCSETYKKVP